VLAAAPAEITLGGLCHETLNGAYALQPGLLNGKARWAQQAGGGGGQLYWSESKEKWIVDTDLDDAGYSANVVAAAAAPPATGWREKCDGAWGARVVTVAERLTAASCSALAAAAFALPVCAIAATELAAAAEAAAGGGGCAGSVMVGGVASASAPLVSAVCPLPCAEPLLAAEARCAAHPAAFAAGAPAGLLPRTCVAAATAVVASAAPTLTVDLDSSACHASLGGAFALLPLPRNGAPQWAGPGGVTLHWDPNDVNCGCPAWAIGESGLLFFAPAEALPLGAAPWVELCHGADQGHTIVALAQAAPTPGECAAALAGLAPALPAACCTAADGAGCGASGAPVACSLDCAAAWAPFAARCPAAVVGLPKVLRKFFGGACAGAVAALAALAPATKMVGCEPVEVPVGCICAGVANADGKGGPSCDAQTIGYWCYTALEACPDSRSSKIKLPDYSWSYLACGNRCTDFIDFDVAVEGGVRYVCDVRAADPDATVDLYVLPPHVGGVGQAVAQETLVANGKALGFTAHSGGKYTVRVVVKHAASAVTASVTAVGTALKRAPAVDASGVLAALGVACFYTVCQIAYAGATLHDGDGSAAIVKLDAVEATAYAVEIALAPGAASGAHVVATFFPPAAAAGAAGFKDVLAGPLGTWRATPKGHSSFFAFHGCTEGDYACPALYMAAIGGGYVGRFRVHAGGTFGDRLTGTWVAAAAGPVLLELALNCDVPVYGDVEYQGCEFRPGGLFCDDLSEGRHGNTCAAALTLAVTAGAYFDPEAAAAGSGGPVAGPATREVELEVGRAELEAAAATMFASTPGGLAAPPTLEQMLVGGSEAGALLATMFTHEQQPHLAFPLDFEGLVTTEAGGEKGGGHRRQLQSAGPQSQGEVVFSGVRVFLKAEAPTELEAQAAVMGLVAMSSSDGGGRRLQADPMAGVACAGATWAVEAEFGKVEIEALVADMFAEQASGADAMAPGGRRRQQSAGPHSQGEATHIFRPSLQCIAAAEAAMHADSEAAEDGRRRLQSTSPWSQGEAARVFRPTLQQMLVVGSQENACLAGIFVAEQQPHQLSLATVAPLPAGGAGGGAKGAATEGNPSCWSGTHTAARCCDEGKGLAGDATCWVGAYDYAFCCDGGHRRAQSQGPASESELAVGVRLTLRATAPTPGEAEARPPWTPTRVVPQPSATPNQPSALV
jgi:hypothetical protein